MLPRLASSPGHKKARTAALKHPIHHSRDNCQNSNNRRESPVSYRKPAHIHLFTIPPHFCWRIPIVKWKSRLGGALAALLVSAVTADAQEIPQPAPAVPQPAPAVPQPAPAVPQPAPETAQPGTETAQPGTENPQVGTDLPQPGTANPGPETANPGYGLEAESLPGELQEDIAQPPALTRSGRPPFRKQTS